MKTSTGTIFGSLAALASANPYYNPEAQASCINAPAETVTVTQTYTAGNNGGYGQGGYGAAPVTVTVTQTAPPQTITETVTYSQATHLPPSYTSTTPVYSNTTSTAAGAHKTYHVDVGTFDGKVQFVPNTLNAAIGDVIEYNFLAKSHSLTQSEFKTPCTFNGGFDTGLNQPNPNNITGLHVIPFTVNTTSPQWFYCKQQGPPNHCGKGMVFGLNPKSQDQMDQFVANAIAQNGNLTGTASPTTSAPSSIYTGYNAIPTVTVGLDAGKTLRFSPPYLPSVPAGSKVHFDFRALNHTLTESSLENPCKKLSPSAVDTGFANANPMDVPGLKTFDLEITNDEPRFFYCKQANNTPKSHCGKGMVFGINTDGKTFAEFQSNAEATLPKTRRDFRA